MILHVLVSMLLGAFIWKFLLSVFYEYFKLGRAYGFDKVELLYKPFTGYEGILKWSG
jgi:hypothetical protein